MHIVRKSDPTTALAILKAGGADAFRAAKDMDIVHIFDLRFDIKSHMTIVFTIKDLGNEQNILQRIRHAFYGDVGIVRCVKSYSRAV